MHFDYRSEPFGAKKDALALYNAVVRKRIVPAAAEHYRRDYAADSATMSASSAISSSAAPVLIDRSASISLR